MPWLTSSSTRAFGIFTTNWAWGVIIAKILPFTFSAPEPNPCRDSRVTSRFPAKAATTGANRASAAALSPFEDPVDFSRRFAIAQSRHIVAPLLAESAVLDVRRPRRAGVRQSTHRAAN